MAIATEKEAEMFIDYNCECEVAGLLEWIVELLPQATFKQFIENIKLHSEDDDA